MLPDCFIRFKKSIAAFQLPERFTFPFQYEPHGLCRLAAGELQARLQEQAWEHRFGHEETVEGVAYGKMFGVLIVQAENREIGYLAAFSGKLAGRNHHPNFVPPVFDLLEENGFFRRGEAGLNDLNRRIAQLEQDPQRQELENLLAQKTRQFEIELAETKARLQVSRQLRQQQREQAAAEADPAVFQALETRLNYESARDHFVLKDLKKNRQQQLAELQSRLSVYEAEIQQLKETRRTKSAALQQQIFEQYTFLNQAGETKSLADIFQTQADAVPPAGAGECAAPKLLQYAFKNSLKPLAMAEFWWGESPIGEVRKHGHFYPACRGKCEPILGHMLHGMVLDEHPQWGLTEAGASIEIVYEDDVLLVVNKPAGLLSVPGKGEYDSVYARMRRLYPEASGPMVVHRLDMSTSGLMLIAKTFEAYKNLQSQFITHRISKRYMALLEGVVADDAGEINLPLRVDLDDRPRQMVCYKHGKAARTRWQVAGRTEHHTRVHFSPLTGRTHQLRVHAAHQHGLNAPILGDELYGQAGTRLCLHAEQLAFVHPESGQTMTVVAPAPF